MNAKDFGNGGTGVARANSSARMAGKLGLGAAALGIAAFGVAAVAGGGLASASVITVLNPNFTNINVAENTYQGTPPVTPGNDTVIPDWGSGPWQGSSGYAGSGDRNFYNTYFAFTDYTGAAIYQDVGAMQPNTSYVLSVLVQGNNPTGWGYGSSGRIALVNTAADSNTATQSSAGTLLASNSVEVADPGTTITATYSTGSVVSGDLSIELSVIAPNPTVNSGSTEAWFTNVGLTGSVVPEPAALGLLGVGGLGLLLVRRRKMA